MTLLNKIFTYLLVLVIGVFIGSIQKCGGKLKTGKTDTITIETTRYIKGDSIIVEKEIPSPVPRATKKYVSVAELNKFLDSVRYYEDKYQIDSSSYAIVKDSVIGKKTWSNFKYFGQPYTKTINTTTTINKTDTLFAEKKRMHFYITGEAGGNENQFNYSVGGSVTTKDRFVFMYRYGIPDKTHNIGVGLKVF